MELDPIGASLGARDYTDSRGFGAAAVVAFAPRFASVTELVSSWGGAPGCALASALLRWRLRLC